MILRRGITNFRYRQFSSENEKKTAEAFPFSPGSLHLISFGIRILSIEVFLSVLYNNAFVRSIDLNAVEIVDSLIVCADGCY